MPDEAAQTSRERAPPLARAEFILGLLFCFVVLINFIGVLARYLGGYAWSGADEIQVYSMIWLVFLGAGIVSWRADHLRMDALVSRFGPAARRWRDLVEAVLTVAVSGLMAWVSLNFALDISALDQHSDGAGIPMWLPHLAPLVGFSLIGLCALHRCWRVATRPD